MSRLRNSIAVAALVVGHSALTFAEEVDFGGYAKIDFATEGTNVVKSRLEIEPSLSFESERGWAFVSSLRLRTDLVDDLIPGTPAYETYAGLSEPLTLGDNVSTELRDFYIDAEVGGVNWRIGKQQIVWGQLDGFKILDQLNPQSFQEFILEDFDQSRIGLWSISAEINVSGADLQLVYSPDTSVGDLPEQGALFAFTAPRYRFGITGTSMPPIIGVETHKPDNPFGDGLYAARLSSYVGGWDIAVVAMTGLDHVPVADLNSTGDGVTLERFYKHRTLIGASASTSFGSFVFRGETGYYPNRSFNTANGLPDRIVKRDQMTLAAAIDFDGPSGFFLSAQIVYDEVLSAPVDLSRPNNDVFLSLYARKYFSNETWLAEARLYAANGLFDDGLFRAELTHALNDETELSAGFDVFFGEPDEVYGQFHERDRFIVQFKRFF